MERTEALAQLEKLIGQDLWVMANTMQGLTLMNKEGKQQKGWAGHVIERYLKLPLNSAQSPNFGSWELKTTSLKYLKSGRLTLKETMAITMIDPVNVIETEFKDSHLLKKLKQQIVVARIDRGFAQPSLVYSIFTFDLDPKTYLLIEQDYNTVRECLLDPKRGFDALTGRMGVYIQPRTKGQKNTNTRAFYARTSFLAKYVFPEGSFV